MYLDLPRDVLHATDRRDVGERGALLRSSTPAPSQIPSAESVTRALDCSGEAERPLIILGKGAAYAQADEQIRTFVEATGSPVPPDVDGEGSVARRPSAVAPPRHAPSCWGTPMW